MKIITTCDANWRRYRTDYGLLAVSTKNKDVIFLSLSVMPCVKLPISRGKAAEGLRTWRKGI